MQELSRLLTLLVLCCLAGCGGSGGGSVDAPSAPPPADENYTISGKVGGGTLTGASVRLVGADGQELVSTTSDQAAGYVLQLDIGNISLPAVVEVVGGSDLVTGQEAGMPLKALVFAEGDQIVNVSVHSTLMAHAAVCSGNVSNEGIREFDAAFHEFLDFGLTTLADTGVDQALNVANIEGIVLMNQAISELVRRAQSALSISSISQSEILEVLACDLADLVIDGVRVDPTGSDDLRVSGVTTAAELSVRLELLTGRLEIDGVDAIPLIDSAIPLVIQTSPDAAAFEPDLMSIRNAVNTAMVLYGAFPEEAISTVLGALVLHKPSSLREQLVRGYSDQVANAINAIPERVALSGSEALDAIAQRKQMLSQAPAPEVTLSAEPTVVVDAGFSRLSWDVMDADLCFADGAWSGNQATAGSIDVGPVDSTVQLRLVCVGLGGATDGSVVVSNSPWFSKHTIALAGCSQTLNWVGDGLAYGFEDITGIDVFTDTTAFAGGSVDRWIEPDSSYLDAFEDAITGSESAILAQVCVRNDVPVEPADLRILIDRLSGLLPGRPIYLMPLDVSTASAGCSFADYDSSLALVNAEVEAGEVGLGPVIDPLYARHETADGCHPNSQGAARMTQAVQDWMDQLPAP